MQTVPETYIQDPDRAVEIAYASKRERCQAIGARLVDEILDPAESTRTDDITHEAAVAARLFEISKDYPEVFEYGFPSSSMPNCESNMLRMLPVIREYGGMPVRPTGHGGYIAGHRRISIEELERTAAMKEVVAEAIIDAPPTGDFLREAGISTFDFDRDPVGKTMGLLATVTYANDEARRAKRHFESRLKVREENKSDNPKMKSAIYLLEEIYMGIVAHTKDKSFESEVLHALNNPSTTLADLENLIEAGVALTIQMYQDDAERAQATFDSIVSGEASQYVPLATPA